jgi:methionine synthase II (cobalamin-independent)
MANEVEQIASIVDHRDLVIQYDVAVEIGALSGAFAAAGELGDKRFIVDALERALATPAGDVERGLHLCYGDYKHRHFTVPQDLSLCVELANAAGDRADFVHMPADRDTGRDPAYYEPLRDLAGCRLALGVIDYEGDEQRTRELVEAAAAGSGGMEFAVATECGMARIDERGPGSPSLERLLELHAMCSSPIR